MIDKASEKSDFESVCLGDSVCRQVFFPDKDEVYFCHLGSTEAITPCGEYLLLHQYLENNPQTKTVYLFWRTSGFSNEFRTDFTYQYFIYPFCNRENMSLIEQESLEEIYDIYGEPFVNSRFIKSVLVNHYGLYNYYLNIIQNPNDVYEGGICPTAAIYLKKMEEECNAKNIDFIVKASPLKDTPENHNLVEFEKDIVQFGLEDIMNEYIDSITYYPEKWFKDDAHFTDDALSQEIDMIRMQMIGEK